MSEIEKIKRYIARTGIKSCAQNRYQMILSEMMALSTEMKNNSMDAVCLAFDYGRAKGYRAAKAEVRK